MWESLHSLSEVQAQLLYTSKPKVSVKGITTKTSYPLSQTVSPTALFNACKKNTAEIFFHTDKTDYGSFIKVYLRKLLEALSSITIEYNS